MDNAVKSPNQYCYRDKFEIFVGDSNSVDLGKCESEKVVQVWLVNPVNLFDGKGIVDWIN